MSQAGEVWTIKRLLEWTTGFFTRKKVDSPRLSAELLLSHVLAAPRIKLYTDFERILSDKELMAYRALVQRASEHEPIAYLTGKAHFFSLEFEVTRNVLIPRPETETLVENVIQYVRNTPGFEAPRVLDLCTGSGCVAAAIAKNIKTAIVVAVDVSPEAVEIGRKNIAMLGLGDRVTVKQGDLYSPLSQMVDRAPFHMIVANAPYIPSSQIPLLDRNVRDYEPMIALDGGLDGLTIHRRILQGGAAHLVPNGKIFLEIAFDQGPVALEIAAQHPEYDGARILKDYGGRDRVLTLRKT